MALHIVSSPTGDVERELERELVGVPTRQRLVGPAMAPHRSSEVDQLYAIIAAKNAHISSLEAQAWAWRAQASNEMRAHRATRDAAWERESELIRVIHRQTLLLQDGAGPNPSA